MNVSERFRVIEACCLTPFVRDWLAGHPAARVLHVFDRACNLVDDRGEIISLVTAELGPGPFAIVLPSFTTRTFRSWITADTQIAFDGSLIKLGPLVVDIAPAVEWLPRPAWRVLQRPAIALEACLPVIKTLLRTRRSADSYNIVAYHRCFAAGTEALISGLATGDINAWRQGARQLAGLGPGLTPAGDDFLVGAMYGLWATHPAESAQYWSNAIVETAVPRTTRLSGAWLRAAARGEAGEAWHKLVRACGRWAAGSEQWAAKSGQCESQEIIAAVERILNTGHTSGADALAGFITLLERGI